MILPVFRLCVCYTFYHGSGKAFCQHQVCLCSWVVTTANKCVLTCQDIAWHTILSLQLAWHAPISVEQTRLMSLSTIWVFFSAAQCTKRHWRFVQPREERNYGVGSPKCCLRVPNGECILHRGAQQKIRGNNHKEQQGKFWLKKYDKEKKCSKREWFSTKACAQRHGGIFILGGWNLTGKSMEHPSLTSMLALHWAEGWVSWSFPAPTIHPMGRWKLSAATVWWNNRCGAPSASPELA